MTGKYPNFELVVLVAAMATGSNATAERQFSSVTQITRAKRNKMIPVTINTYLAIKFLGKPLSDRGSIEFGFNC